MHAADGRIVWLRDIVSVRPAADGGRRLAGIALDITSEKQGQADKRRTGATQEQLAQAMKMEAVGRLAGCVVPAHGAPVGGLPRRLSQEQQIL